MIPEIWNCILNFIDDVEDICNCRLVCKDFKDLIERSTEQMKNKNSSKNITISFISQFPHLKYLNVSTKMSNIFLLKNLKVVTFNVKHDDLIQYISAIEDLLFPFSPHYIHEKKIIKIYTEQATYWLSQYKYGRYAKHDYDEIDEYMRDATRCKTFISNKKPFQYFPVRNFIYVCPVEELSGFDYYPSQALRKYTWQPVLGGQKEIYYFKYIEYLAESVLELDRNDEMKTYEIPILEADLGDVKSLLPKGERFAILKPDSIVYSDHTTYFNDLPQADAFIDNIFKF